jgi:membrane protein
VALLWFYISAFAVILGAELNAELELQTERDTTTGPERPIGQARRLRRRPRRPPGRA